MSSPPDPIQGQARGQARIGRKSRYQISQEALAAADWLIVVSRGILDADVLARYRLGWWIDPWVGGGTGI
jgi:hypothetical protein